MRVNCVGVGICATNEPSNCPNHANRHTLLMSRTTLHVKTHTLCIMSPGATIIHNIISQKTSCSDSMLAHCWGSVEYDGQQWASIEAMRLVRWENCPYFKIEQSLPFGLNSTRGSRGAVHISQPISQPSNQPNNHTTTQTHNQTTKRKGTVSNSFIGRDMQDCLLLAKRKFGGAKIHYKGIYNTHAIDPMYALKVCRVNDIYRKAVKDNTPSVSYINKLGSEMWPEWTKWCDSLVQWSCNQSGIIHT